MSANRRLSPLDGPAIAVRPPESVTHILVQPKKRQPLAQVEVLMLFSPDLQSGSHRVAADKCESATQAWLTLDVHGRIGTSELSGLPIIEDLRLEAGGEDIEALLPESLVSEIERYVANN